MNPTEARRRIAAIRADQGHPFFEESHPGHTRAVRDMEGLYTQAYPEPPVENPFDQPVPVQTAPPADPGIKHREPRVFWQQSTPISREELEVAQVEEGRRRADAREIGRSIGRLQNEATEAEILRAQGTARNASAIAQGFLSMVQNWAEDQRQGARDFDLAYKVSRMGPEEQKAYVAGIAERLRKQGETVPEDLADRLMRFDLADPSSLTEGYYIDTRGKAVFRSNKSENIASEGEEDSVLGGLNKKTNDERDYQRDINRNSGMPADGRKPDR